MTHNFILNFAAGWLAPLPEKARQEVSARAPGVSVEAVSREYSWYLVRRDATEGQPAAREIKRMATEFQRMVTEMLAVAEPLKRNHLGSMIENEATVRGYPDTLRDLVTNLMIVQKVMPLVTRELPTGHAVNNRHLLVSGLLPILEQAQLRIDERPNGPLCQVVGIILAAAGESPSSIVTIVRPVVRALKKTAKK